MGLRRINGELYYVEELNPTIYVIEKIEEIIYSKKSNYQLIEVIDSPNFGRTLILDNVTQICEADEYIYHEVFVHPVMICHPNPRKVLIIGGGDGGVLREVLKHSIVEKAVLVEIDREVIEVVKKFMPFVPQGAFDDPRSEIIIMDGLKYVNETNLKFDVVFLDLTDVIGPSVPLYSVNFYKKIKGILNSNGIVVIQALDLDHRPEALRKICNDLNEVFSIVDYYFVYVPSFTGRWAFAFGSEKYNPMEIDLKIVKNRFAERKLMDKTRFYNPDIHFTLKVLKDVMRINS